MRRIRVSAVVLRRADGRVLMVRKRQTSMFMNPGGKPEPGETPRQCVVREVREELGLELDPRRLVYLGDLSAAAANEADHLVDAWVFADPEPVTVEVSPRAEIEEIRWVGDHEVGAELSPLFLRQIRPAARR